MGYAAAFGALAGAMLIFPLEAAAAAARGLALWAKAVVPVLGPFMACMLMVASRVGGGLPARAGLGWLCGSPGGARLMQTIRPRGRAALRGAALSGTMSPMFFLGTVSAWLKSPRAGRIIFLCHIAGAMLVGLCLPKERGGAPASGAPLSLADALRGSSLALLSAALCMMLGAAAGRMAECAFPQLPPLLSAGLQCLLEVTNGVRKLIDVCPSNTPAWVCAACSFGGLSIIAQNAAVWQESGVSIGQLVLIQLCHAAVSFFLCLLLA